MILHPGRILIGVGQDFPVRGNQSNPNTALREPIGPFLQGRQILEIGRLFQGNAGKGFQLRKRSCFIFVSQRADNIPIQDRKNDQQHEQVYQPNFPEKAIS